MVRASFAALAALAVGCGGPHMIPLLSAAGVPVTQTPSSSTPLEVITRATGIHEPVPVEGASVTYADVETTLGHAISSAAVPWAEARRARRPGGYELSVELTQAYASYTDGRLVVTLGTRATLRAREGRVYLAQTQAHCRQAGMVPPDAGAPVIFSCEERIGRDLAGWLAQVEPLDAAEPEGTPAP